MAGFQEEKSEKQLRIEQNSKERERNVTRVSSENVGNMNHIRSGGKTGRAKKGADELINFQKEKKVCPITDCPRERSEIGLRGKSTRIWKVYLRRGKERRASHSVPKKKPKPKKKKKQGRPTI